MQLDISNPMSVVAHGLRQKSRGRKPSAPYRSYNRTFTNPREAFREALKELTEAGAGEHISNYCRRLVDLSPLYVRIAHDSRFVDHYAPRIFDGDRGYLLRRGAVVGRFNDVLLVAEPNHVQATYYGRDRQFVDFQAWNNATADMLYDLYTQAADHRYQAYQASPEAAEARRVNAEYVQQQGVLIAELIEELRAGDMKDLSTVLAWWYRFAGPADYSGVAEAAAASLGMTLGELRTYVITFFAEAGFVPDAEVIEEGPGYEVQRSELGNSEERMARYIIGQCLSMTQMVGCPHPVATLFIERWFLRFKYLPALIMGTDEDLTENPIYKTTGQFQDPEYLREELHQGIDHLDDGTVIDLVTKSGLVPDADFIARNARSLDLLLKQAVDRKLGLASKEAEDCLSYT